MRVSLTDRARIKTSGYVVTKHDHGWTLTDNPNDPMGYLFIGDHGAVSPTEWEAYAEALKRIEQDERIAAEQK